MKVDTVPVIIFEHEKHPGGRPSSYHPKYCRMALKLMSKGYSKWAVAAKIGISRDTLYEWCKVHEKFSDSIKKGEAASLWYWEKVGRDAMFGQVKGFSARMWIYIMKSRFGWRG